MGTYATNIPGSAGYAQASLLAQKAYANAMSRLQQQRSQTMTKYGVRKGAGGGYEADPYNEYGQYQQMLRGEDQQGEHMQRSQAASGWGTDSGYLGAQRDDLAHNQGAEQANLGQNMLADFTGIDQGEQQASYDKDSALYSAELDAARNAVNNQTFNPGDYSGLPEVPYGPGVSTSPAVGKPKLRRAVPVHQQGKQKIMRRKQQVRKGGR